jgi:hypothetical protein
LSAAAVHNNSGIPLLFPTAQSTLYVLDRVLIPPSTDLLPPPSTPAAQRDTPSAALSVMQALHSDPQARNTSTDLYSPCFATW